MVTEDEVARVLDEREAAITVVCDAGFRWAGEYGFSDPQEAQKVWEAAKLLRPELEPKRA